MDDDDEPVRTPPVCEVTSPQPLKKRQEARTDLGPAAAASSETSFFGEGSLNNDEIFFDLANYRKNTGENRVFSPQRPHSGEGKADIVQDKTDGRRVLDRDAMHQRAVCAVESSTSSSSNRSRNSSQNSSREQYALRAASRSSSHYERLAHRILRSSEEPQLSWGLSPVPMIQESQNNETLQRALEQLPEPRRLSYALPASEGSGRRAGRGLHAGEPTLGGVSVSARGHEPRRVHALPKLNLTAVNDRRTSRLRHEDNIIHTNSAGGAEMLLVAEYEANLEKCVADANERIERGNQRVLTLLRHVQQLEEQNTALVNRAHGNDKPVAGRGGNARRYPRSPDHVQEVGRSEDELTVLYDRLLQALEEKQKLVARVILAEQKMEAERDLRLSLEKQVLTLDEYIQAAATQPWALLQAGNGFQGGSSVPERDGEGASAKPAPAGQRAGNHVRAATTCRQIYPERPKFPVSEARGRASRRTHYRRTATGAN
eukprot:g8742.t1